MSTLETPTRARPAAVPAAPRVVDRRRRRRSDALRLALACASLTAVVAAMLYAFGPPGVDRAAHLYHLGQFERSGWRLWNNYWYAGRYELLNYSVIFYPLAAVAGEAVVLCASLAAGSGLFALLARAVAGRRGNAAAIAFALGWPLLVVSGQEPFALGTCFAIGAVLSLRHRRHAVGLVAALLCLLSSPLSFLLLTIVLAGIAVGARRSLQERRTRLAAAGVVGLLCAEAVVLRVFPIEGRFPFPVPDLVGILLFCGAGLAFARESPGLRGVFGAYGVAGVAAFLYPSGVGGNTARLLDYFALPLLLLALAPRGYRPRLAAVAAIVVAVLWQAIPVARDLRGGLLERADSANFWAGGVGWLKRHASDPNFRVNAPPTWGHWESYYLPREDIPITRGWFRQNDYPFNEPLYDGALDARSYEAWLRSLGVRYVVLPNDELDYSARKEAELLRSPSHAGLHRVYHDANVDIFELAHAQPLLTALATDAPAVADDRPAVTKLTGGSTTWSLWLPAPGIYQLRVRYTRYWRSSDPERVCVTSDGPSNITRLYARSAGPVNLVFDLTVPRSTGQVLGDAAPSCTFPPFGGTDASSR